MQSTSLILSQIDLTNIPDLQNVASGTVITIRYYASGQTTTGGWGFSSSASGINGLAIGGSAVSVSLPTKLVISSILPSSPTAGSGFDVTVEARDANNIISNVTALTGFSLSTNGNSGIISGTTTGSIAAGTNSTTVRGVVLASTGTGVTLTTTQTTGDALATGTSSEFVVLAPASRLAFGTNPPSTAIVGSNLASFTVEAKRPDNSIDNTYNGNIVVSKASGSGVLSGTTTVAAVAGIATFSTLQLTPTDTYTLTASATGLTSITSDNIVINNTTAILWTSVSGTSLLTSGSWSSGAVPTTTQVIQFGVNPTPNTNIGLNTNPMTTRTFAGIEITANRLISLSLGNSDVNDAGVNLQLNGAAINSVPNVIIRNNSDSSFTLKDTILGGGGLGLILGNTTNNIINIDGMGDVIISSIISGQNKKLTKAGSGTGILNLTGANTYTGLTTVSAGTLQLNRTGGTTLPVGNDITISGGTLKISSNQTLNNLTLLSGTLTVDVGATLTINGTFVFSGGTINNSGTIAYGSNATLIYSGSTPQTTGMEYPTTNSPTHLTINNAAGVTLNGAKTVNGTLTLTSGNLASTTTNKLTLANSATITRSSGMVTGVMSREISAATGTHLFPIGDGTTYRSASVQFTAAPTAGTLTAEFKSIDPGTPTASFTEGGITIGNTSPTGYWSIVATTLTGGTYDITVDATGFKKIDNTTTITDLANTRLVKRESSTGANGWAVSGGTAVQPSSLSAVSITGLTSFSEFALGSAGAVLPVELTKLNVKAQNQQNILSWQTLIETNMAYFDIERTNYTPSNWQTIGTLKAAGNSQTIKDYQFIDDTPLSINYYRLRLVDTDGKQTLSNVVSVLSNGKGQLQVFPTRATDKLTINTSSHNGSEIYIIYNLLGKTVQLGQLNEAKEVIISDLPTELYLLKIGYESVKFFKN